MEIKCSPKGPTVETAPEVDALCIRVTALARALAMNRKGTRHAIATPQDTIAAATLIAGGCVSAKAIVDSPAATRK